MISRNNSLKPTRARCKDCAYPLSTCVCAQVEIVSCQSRIDILQHASEVKSAKNTAKLIPLCIPETKIWLGDIAEDFLGLSDSLKNESRKVLVLYPNVESEDISTVVKANEYKSVVMSNSHTEEGYRLILLDGTWKKSYRLWMNNPWLKDYQTIHLNSCNSNYHIRKAPKPHCLSTIEALAFSLDALEPELDVSPLLNVFQEMQSNFFRRVDV